MTITVKVSGLAEIQSKLNGEVLIDPYMSEAVDTVMERPLRVRKSRQGAGIRNNTLRGERRGLSGTVTSTLNNPRQTGASWLSYNIAAIRKMLPNVMKKAVQRIETRWRQ